MTPLMWALVHIAAGLGVVALFELVHAHLTRDRDAETETAETVDAADVEDTVELDTTEAPTVTMPEDSDLYVLNVSLGGRLVQLYSDQPFGPDTIRAVARLLVNEVGPVEAVAGVHTLINAIVANEAAGLDDELDTLGGAA